ncbi:protein containing cell adhesion domain protein [Bacillus pacificus]
MAKVGDKIDGAEPGWSNISFDNSSITYTGMTKGVSYAYGSGSTASYSFTFTGTAVRIITGLFSDGATNAQIKIDNTVEYADFKGTSGDPHIVYEKTKLPYGTHTITVRANGSGTLSLRAIHYAAFANQGDKLVKPELGWQRHKFDEKLSDGTEAVKYYPENIWTRYSEYIFTTKPNVGYIRFKFYGSAIRIISTHFSDTATMARIIIDGKTSYYNSRGGSDGDRLSFENSNLPLGIHTVEIYTNNTGNLSLSAIDLKDGEYLVPLVKIGEDLLQPEPGWTRYDDTHSNIKYLGTWKVTNSGYNSSLHYKNENVPPKETVAIKFKFYGKSLRIIGLKMAYYSQNALIQIDDNEPELISFYGETINTCLLYEKTGLKEENHTVTIWGENINLDAIDFNAEGYLIPTVKVGDRLIEPEPGWKRFDDTDTRIFYENPDGGTWKKISVDPIEYYNGTTTFKKHLGMPRLKVKFKFKGIQLRILATRYSTTVSKYEEAKILIDGVQYVYNQNGTSNQYCTLLFESPILNQDVHTVEITTGKDPFDLDCIDILGGELFFEPAKVGDVLTQPEPGWKRFDDTDSNIQYKGPWQGVGSTNNGYYNLTMRFKNKSHGSEAVICEFGFTGTGISVIGAIMNNSEYYQKPINITIDGITETYSMYRPNINERQVLLYQKTNLKPGSHTVKIEAQENLVDAFDIQDGSLFTPVKVGDVLKDPESGWKRFDDRDPNILYQGNWIENENITTHYRGTFHNKPSSSGDDSIVKALFDFSGTKVRIIAFMTTGSYDVGTIKIDGEAFNFSYIKGTPTAQCLVFEKVGLEPGIHKVELSGRYINLDAIDIDETGELIPIEIKKPKVSLYEKESGKVFVDDFDSINPKWLMSPFTAFNNVAKTGFLRMNHSADKDVLLLIDKPQGNVAIQVIADYTPTKEGDKGGLLIYKNEANNIEFLESMKVSDSPDPKEWMAVCKENQWDFYNKTDITFDYVRSEQLDAHKIGVVLKKGNTEGFTPLDINKIIITTSNLLRLRQLYEKYKVVLKDATENVISTSFVESANTGIDIALPSLEFEGIVEIYDEDGTLVAKRQTTFFGGDMYCMGSSLHISMDTKELDETDPTHLGYMTETERLVKMTLTNDNVGPVSNVKVAIQQYMEKFGYTWAHLSLDGSHYTNELAIETLNAGSSKDFWVKIIKDVNYMAFEPIYFNIHLSHE